MNFPGKILLFPVRLFAELLQNTAQTESLHAEAVPGEEVGGGWGVNHHPIFLRGQNYISFSLQLSQSL